MKAIITGSSGVIGKVLMQRLKKHKHQAVALKHTEFDVNDAKLIDAYLNKEKPDVIFHLAKSDLAMSEHLAKWTKEHRRALVYTSSFKVFGGKKTQGPYAVYDTPDGTDEIAKTKQAHEKAIFEVNPNAYVVRLSWQITPKVEAYGLLAFLKDQMDKRGKISVSENHYPSVMFVEDTCDELIRIVTGYQPGLYHLNQNDWYSFYDIVHHLKHKLGHDWIELDKPRSLKKNDMLDTIKFPHSTLTDKGFKYLNPRLP